MTGKFRKSLVALAAWAALGTAGAGIGGAEAQDRVRVGLSSHGLLFMPTLAAEAMGYFDEEGLDGEIVMMGGANKVYSALISGDIDVSVSASVSILRGRAGGTDLTMIGAAMNQHGSNVVATREWAEKHGITETSTYEERLKALKGITISTASVGGGSDQLIRLLAEEAGLNADRDMTLTVLGVGDTTLAAFARRRVDAITHSSPVAVKAIRDHDGMMLFHLTAGAVPAYDGFLYLAYATRESWIEANPDVARRYARAMARAHAALRDPAQRDAIMTAVHEAYHTNIDRDLYEAAWDDYVTAFPARIDLDAAMVERAVALSEKFDGAEPLTDDVIAQAWTNRLVEAAGRAD